MTEIYVDTEEMRRAIAILAWQHYSVTARQREISVATQPADGYEGQLRRDLRGLPGDRFAVRVL